MTCIVAIAHDGHVTMGGDSAGVSGYDLQLLAEPKIFRNRGLLIGYTTSFRMGQLLQYEMTPPLRDPADDDMAYIVRRLIPVIRTLLSEHGFASKYNNVEQGGSFLLGYRGGVYGIHSDYQVARTRDGFDAVGSGTQVALGAMHATAEMGLDPARRIALALAAAERFTATVRGPFELATLAPETP